MNLKLLVVSSKSPWWVCRVCNYTTTGLCFQPTEIPWGEPMTDTEQYRGSMAKIQWLYGPIQWIGLNSVKVIYSMYGQSRLFSYHRMEALFCLKVQCDALTFQPSHCGLFSPSPSNSLVYSSQSLHSSQLIIIHDIFTWRKTICFLIIYHMRRYYWVTDLWCDHARDTVRCFPEYHMEGQRSKFSWIVLNVFYKTNYYESKNSNVGFGCT